MLMTIIINIGLIVIFWICNIIISRPILLELGLEDEMSKKSVANGNNLFYSIFALLLAVVSFYWIDILKYPIVIFSGLYLAWEVVTLTISIVMTVLIVFKEKISQKLEFILILSNALGALGEIVVLVFAIKYLF